MEDANKKIEELLAEIKFLKDKAAISEKFNESIVKTAIDAIITINEDGTIMSWNQAAQNIFGYHSNEIVNKDISEIIPNKHAKTKKRNTLKRLVSIRLKSIIGQTTEFIAKRKDGTEFPIELSASIWESNENTFITGIIRDISEREFSNYELQKLNLALKNSKEVVFMTDVDGIFTYINPQFTKMYGYESFEVIGLKTPRILKSPLNKRDFNLFWKKLLNKESISTTQYVNIKKDGTIVHIEGSADPIINSKGKIIGFLGIQRDISQRIKVLDNLKEALAKAKESDRLKSEFLATMSHELRTPLNSIIGLSNLIDETTSKSDVIEYNNIINSSGEHLLSIVDDLFDISLIESGQIKVIKTRVNLHSILLEVESLMKIEQQKLNKEHLDLNLIISEEDKGLTIYTDELKLKRILKNILKNALKFTEKGYINYGYTVCENNGVNIVKFFIKDTGIGIHENYKEVIFEVFRQVNGSFNRKHEGIGIGLSTVKKLLILLGGNIWVDSLEGKGSSFYFTLPMEGENSLTEVNNVTKTDSSLKEKTVLIAEEDDYNYEFLKSVLELNNINQIRAENGEIAVEHCSNNPKIDLVLMDIDIPILNGYEASKQIRGIKPKLPIIAQSAYDKEGDKEKAFEVGCNEYITKPIVINEFIELINKYLVKGV